MCRVEEGTVARSAAGRDKDRFFVVMKTEGGYAWICDGKLRPLGRQKRKKILHLRPTGTKVDPRTLTTDRLVRAALRDFAGGGAPDGPAPDR